MRRVLVMALLLSGCGYVGTVERDMYTADISVRVPTDVRGVSCGPARVGRRLLLAGPTFWHGPHNTQALQIESAHVMDPVGLQQESAELTTLPQDSGGMILYTPGYLTNPKMVSGVQPVPVAVNPGPQRYQVVVTVRVTAEPTSAKGVLVKYSIGGRHFEDHYRMDFEVKASC